MALRRAGKRQKIDGHRAADPGAALSAATALLRARDHAGSELEGKLLERGFEPPAALAAVDELRERGLLDDARFAESFVRARAGRGQGPVRIAQELRSRGISPQQIEAALGTVPSWDALAQGVRSRKFGGAPPDSVAEKGRQARFLQYRGFSSDHIGSALRGALDPDLAP